jgi:A/G-specific adenine glycosylase
MVNSAQIASFQKKILTYYQKNHRNLPWRTTTNPYYILLSEIMLQQTQVDRVIPYYQDWISTWPTIHDLAQASRVDVLKKWIGLGYNNRAVRVHELANTVSTTYQGDLLKAMKETKLPGIGPYTQHAVRIFAANEDLTTIDTNIRRILIHEFHLPESISDEELQSLAHQCLPQGKSRDWHNALMDYGATFLTSRKTGIKPKTQQSKFEGSDRQIRAMILRYLLKKSKKCSILDIQKALHLSMKERKIKNILKDMIRDDLVLEEDNRYTIKS